MKRKTEAPALNPIHVAELIWLYEDMALTAEISGLGNASVMADCIRKQAPGMLEAIETMEALDPGYADLTIRALAAACGVQLPE